MGNSRVDGIEDKLKEQRIGMKWVNASERKPDKNWYGICRIDKYDGGVEIGNHLVIESILKEGYELTSIEWLDENQQND
jgi:hypothetical protein